MNRDEIEGKWKQLKGKAQAEWGKLTDSELNRTEGQRDRMVGLLQEKFGKTREQAEREFDSWASRL
jgi:uncharacterized protein YjbJ (UPF0337 family)